MRRLTAVIGPDECLIALGLALIAFGFALMPSWNAGAALAPGIVLLWIALPQRSAFVRRDVLPAPPARKR